MSKLPSNYIEKVYAGWLGKVIGVRHGGNVEGWTYEQFERTFGDVKGYLHTFKNFAADDDTNGTFIFLRALEDFTHTTDITPEQMGQNLLNYPPDGHGFFWWGGYGNSTEHTAYLNLKNGIKAPHSGSVAQNGRTVAEQIGGQIFCDGFGLIAPGQPKLAAEYAGKMASVTHDENGVYGAMFIAACIATAFAEKDIRKILDSGLSVIPSDCEYARVTKEVIRYHDENPSGGWRDCFKFVKAHFGYDKYPGNCHIIPNAAVIILSLLYGKGDFSDSINICNMCGWDTDCNVANVGCIIGVRNGLEGIDSSWREPINDFLCVSTVLGSLNILDLPQCAAYIANLGYKIAGEPVPEEWADILSGRGPRAHFKLPGSTHAMRLDTDAQWQVTGKLENSGEETLRVLFDRSGGGQGYRVYYQTYYRPEDFNDNRYDPCFSPILYPGQTVSSRVKIPDFIKSRIEARLYVKDRNENVRHYGEHVILEPETWTDLSYAVPSMGNVCLIEAGIEFIPLDGRNSADWQSLFPLESLVAYVDFLDFSGDVDYSIDFSKERLEKYSNLHIEISQFTYLRGIWTLEDGQLSGSYYGEPAECYTGQLTWEDYSFEGTVLPKLGDYHNLQFRVQGGARSYAVGLAPGGKVALYKNKNGYSTLSKADYEWRSHSLYSLRVEAVKNTFKVFVDGSLVMEYTDTDEPYLNGQIGFSNSHASHTHFTKFAVKGM